MPDTRKEGSAVPWIMGGFISLLAFRLLERKSKQAQLSMRRIGEEKDEDSHHHPRPPVPRPVRGTPIRHDVELLLLGGALALELLGSDEGATSQENIR